MGAKKIRIPLVGLNVFVGVTAIAGAVLVVPSLPVDWLKVFPDYTIPAIGLGAVGAISLAAALAVVARPKIGAELSVVAGAMMVTFEVVEALAVGNLLAPPPVSNSQGSVALWLQVVYLVVGVAVATLGLRLWTRLVPRDGWAQRVRHSLAFR
jgi:hypothetical protein